MSGPHSNSADHHPHQHERVVRNKYVIKWPVDQKNFQNASSVITQSLSYVECRTLEISECTSLTNCFFLLRDRSFLSSFYRSPKSIGVIFKLPFKVQHLKNFHWTPSSISKNWRILLAFKAERNFLILFKTPGDKMMRLYNEMSSDLCSDSDIDKGFNTIVDMLVQCIDDCSEGIDKSYLNLPLKEVRHVRNIGGKDLLTLAIEKGCASTTNFALACSIVPTKDHSNAALARKDYELLGKLLLNNAPYPDGFSEHKDKVVEQCPQVRLLISVQDEMYLAIRSGSIEKVSHLIQKFPNIRHFYNFDNCSAPSYAKMQNNYKIDALLLANNVTMGAHESALHHTEYYRNGFKKSKTVPEDVLKLILSCKPKGGFIDNKVFRKAVADAFEYISSIPEMNRILKNAAKVEDLCIYFDVLRLELKNENDYGVKGLTSLDGKKVSIAAKSLFECDNGKEDTYGTLAHELTHVALISYFRNDAKPYFRNKNQEAVKWDMVYESICRKMSNNGNFKDTNLAEVMSRTLDPIIRLGPERRHAELAVIIPQICNELKQKRDLLIHFQYEFYPLLLLCNEYLKAMDCGETS